VPGQTLGLTVLHVAYSLDSGTRITEGTPGLHCRSPNSGEVQCKSKASKKSVWSHSEGWWEGGTFFSSSSLLSLQVLEGP